MRKRIAREKMCGLEMIFESVVQNAFFNDNCKETHTHTESMVIAFGIAPYW